MIENTSIDIFRYEVPEGVSEYHAMLRITNHRLTFKEQVDCLMEAYDQLMQGEMKGAVAVFKRFFVSDAANQANYLQALHAERSDCALSIIEQPHWMEPKLLCGFIYSGEYRPKLWRMVSMK